MEMEAELASGRWWTWNAAAGACLLLLLMHVAARVADALWWRPRRLEAHFARQGVRGPPYRFLLGCVTEMVALMAEAAAKPMSPPDSHDALPRVLAFYHYWRKIYGTHTQTHALRSCRDRRRWFFACCPALELSDIY
jgi:PHYB activation tagged suppressor 1